MRRAMFALLALALLLAGCERQVEAHGPGPSQFTPTPVAAQRAVDRLQGARLEFTHAVAAACLVRARAVNEGLFDVVERIDDALQGDDCSPQQ